MNHIYNTDAIELMNSIPSRSIPLQIHDIPYFIEPFQNSIKMNNGSGIIRDFGGWDSKNINFVDFAKSCSDCASIDSNVIIFYNNWFFISDLIKELFKYFDSVDTLVWYKTNPKPQIRRRQFVNNHELIIYARRGKHTLNFTKHSDMYSIRMNSLASGRDRVKIYNENGKRINAHPTQKPVKLIEYYIEKLSNPGDTILDAYAGVLTTGIAALRCGRNFIVNDLDSNYIKYGFDYIISEFSNENIIMHDKGEIYNET